MHLTSINYNELFYREFLKSKAFLFVPFDSFEIIDIFPNDGKTFKFIVRFLITLIILDYRNNTIFCVFICSSNLELIFLIRSNTCISDDKIFNHIIPCVLVSRVCSLYSIVDQEQLKLSRGQYLLESCSF